MLEITRNKKKKRNKIFILAKSKLNSIETLVSEALIDLEISRKGFKTIVNEKWKYEKKKENIRIINSDDEKHELMENNKDITENGG